MIAGDTTEAELIVMSSAANKLMWLKQFCTDVNLNAYMPTLWGDNKSANLLATNPVSSDRSKHMRLIAKASDLYGGALSSGQAVGLGHDCEGCQ